MNTAAPANFVEERPTTGHRSTGNAQSARNHTRGPWARNGWRNAPAPTLVGTWGRRGR